MNTYFRTSTLFIHQRVVVPCSYVTLLKKDLLASDMYIMMSHLSVVSCIGLTLCVTTNQLSVSEGYSGRVLFSFMSSVKPVAYPELVSGGGGSKCHKFK